jgi:hypothetical protein
MRDNVLVPKYMGRFLLKGMMPKDVNATQQELRGGGPEPHALDVVPPARIALLVEEVGIKKADMELVPMLTLGVLAGAFVAFGGMFYTSTITGSELGFGPTRLLGGLAFLSVSSWSWSVGRSCLPVIISSLWLGLPAGSRPRRICVTGRSFMSGI